MATLDFQALFQTMVGAAKESFADKWPGIQELGTSSFKKLATSLVEIEQLKLSGSITEEQAHLLLDMEKNTFKIVLLSVQGIGLLTVEAALNAALNAIKSAVNTAVGIALL